jgi:uncharacterized protein
MGLIRLLIWIFIIWLAIHFIKRWLNAPSKKRQPPKAKRIETFVACHKCGLHIPQQEAIESQGRYYCSEAHRDSDRH